MIPIAEPLRVLQCVVGMNRGGLETLTMNILRRIDSTKVQFDFLVSLEGSYDEEIRELGGRIFYTPFIDKVGPFRYAKNLRKFFKEHPEYKIIHIQMDKFGGFIAKQAKNAKIPYRLIHSHSTRNDGNFLIRLVKDYYGRYIKCATHFLACGEAAAEWMFKRTNNIKYVRNGVDLSVFTNEDKRDHSFFTIGHVGRFNSVKNHTFLVDIFQELKQIEPSSRLVLVGDGIERESIKDKVEALELSDYVEFLGQTDDVASILKGIDVFCLPSLFEGLPITLIEAQACGLPCVVSDTITKEAKISSDSFEYMNLDSSPKVWAEKLLEFKGFPRIDNSEKIRIAGYDISKVVEDIQEYYLSISSVI